MDLSFLGWIELFFSRSLRWTGLHPALSSAFMQSPPFYTWAAEIRPETASLDSGEIKMPPYQGGNYTQ